MQMKPFNQRSSKGPRPNSEFSVDEIRLDKVLSGDTKELNKSAMELSRRFLEGKDKEKLSTSQIRNVFDEIQKMKTFDENKLQLLRPKLAYAAGRHGGRVKDFQKLLDAAIEKTNNKNFDFFKNFVEAILAYHRYFGGK